MSDKTLTDIDELIAYVESPEYLRMVASYQGEDPSGLLATTTPEENSPIRWNHSSGECVCIGCIDRRWRAGLRNIPRASVRLRSRQDSPEAFASVLSELRPFTTPTNNLRGVHIPQTQRRTPGDARPCGQLASKSPTSAALWRADQRAIDYVVYSYQTPIAWHATGNGWEEWIFPKVRYSKTTTQHQNKIKAALDPDTMNVRVIREGD